MKKHADEDNTVYVSSSTAKTIANYLRSEGVDTQDIESITDCKITDLESADFRLPLDRYHTLWDFAIERTGNPALGLELGTNPLDEDMGLVGHIFFNSPTLRDALKQYERYYSVVNEGMHVSVDVTEDLVYVKYICDLDRAYSIPDMDRTMAISVHRAREHFGDALHLEYVGFQHEAPSYESRYRDIFPCEIHFQQSNTCLVFKKHYLSYPLKSRSNYLHKVLIRHVEGLLKRIRHRRNLTEQVRKIVSQRMDRGSFDAAQVAKRLNMSRNTLYRKLKKEGSVYHDLVDEVRKQKALRYMDDGSHSLSDIAFLLGFSELSAFSRAFKRWTGYSPANYSKSRKNAGQ